MTAWMTLKPWEPLSVTLSERRVPPATATVTVHKKPPVLGDPHSSRLHLRSWLQRQCVGNNLFDTKYAYSEGFIEEGRISGQVSSIRSDVKADSGICILSAL